MMAKPESVVINCSKFGKSNDLIFNEYIVYDDPSKVEHWGHVAACFVTGHAHQFREYFNKKLTKPELVFNQ
eukprot:gene25064-10917_t